MTKILIADDEESIRTILAKAMEKKGFEVHLASDGKQALEMLQNTPIDVAILDIRMPEITGLSLLDHQSEFKTETSVLVITAEDTMENAVEAMKKGAYDYLTKPFDLNEMGLLVERALETRQLKQENLTLKQSQTLSHSTSSKIVGKSKAIQEIYKMIGRVANQKATVLIDGESGTGKELIARAIHVQGDRNAQPFVAVNSSAIPANLLESELFGAKKGAYTGLSQDHIGYFEQANGGTLFLDEIGEMPTNLQAKLLRVLQENEIQRLGDDKTITVDVRIIAATNQNLKNLVSKGVFREDLYFRLSVILMTLPPLRDRKSDIPILADHFLTLFSSEAGIPPKRIAEKALDYLMAHDWPGNIRELENLIKRVFVLTSSDIIEVEDLKNSASSLKPAAVHVKDLVSLEDFVEASLVHIFENTPNSMDADLYHHLIPIVERPLIRLALKRTQGNQLKAADLLGINRNTLRKKIRELKVDRRGLLDKN